jgi:primosomal protein N'
MKYAEVAVHSSVHQTFHYHIPEALEGYVTWGHLVRVAFGTAMLPAIVVDLHDALPPELAELKTKPIIEILDPEPVMRDEHLELGLWMSRAYLTAPSACLWLMLPPGMVGKSSKRLIHLLDEEADGNNETEAIILEMLRQNGSLDVNFFKKIPPKDLQKALRVLEKSGSIRLESYLRPPRVAAKTVTTVMRAIPEDAVLSALSSLKRSKKQSEAFNHIALFDYPLDVSEVYEVTQTTKADLNALEKRGLVVFGERIVYRDSLADKDFIPSEPLELTHEQAAVWEEVKNAITPIPDNPTPTASAARSDSTPPASEEGANSASAKVPPPFTGEARRGLHIPFKKENSVQWRSSPELWAKIKPIAKELRREQTPAERFLWEYLRKHQIQGVKFRRQQNIEQFIVDFFAPEFALIIEIDGKIHLQTIEEDAIRQEFLEMLGYQFLRFTNEDVFNKTQNVIAAIKAKIAELRVNPTPTLPASEEGVNTLSTKVPPPFTGEARRGSKFLLHGVTGSGKTEIYLQAIAATLAQGRQAIFLVPEIALTPQTIRRVAQRFPEKVAVVHSGLSEGERFDTWRRARDGDIGVIVGTRSALFTPLPDIGLIILDEEHDHSYKHQPPMLPPYYHAREVAEQLVELNDAILILGSATPDMESYFRAKRGDLAYLHMPNRITGHRQRIEKQAKQRGVISAYQPIEAEAMGIGLPPVQIVDMREELRNGNRGMFSQALQAALTGVIQRGEQAILFLNRRGQNSYVFCRDCGYRVDCGRCDMPMTYHRDGEAMRCHYCDNKAPVPTICPVCQSERIRYFGAGTQQVEQELFHAFPSVTTVRWDRDTAEKPDDHEAILAKFAGGEVDVMVGTQMIAKGLDVPLVTLVGVISADPGLALPDFRANERAFQLLTQVAGRAGRGVLGGQVILQTYNPQHPSILMASQHDYEGFYKQEIEARRELGYPPFRRLARVLVQQASAKEAQKQIEEAATQIRLQIERKNLSDTSIIGPAPCFFSRIDKLYRWQLIVRSNEPIAALDALQLRQGWYLEIDPVDIL